MPPEPHNPRRALSPPIGEALCLYLLYHLSRQPRAAYGSEFMQSADNPCADNPLILPAKPV